jgi:hypothetical protein
MDILNGSPSLVCDNAIDNLSFKKICEHVRKPEFRWDYWPVGKRYIDYDPNYPWFLDPDTGKYTNQNKYKDSFSSMGLVDNRVVSEIGGLCKDALLQVASRLNLKIKNIYRVRLGLILPKEDGKIINMPHVDNEIPHYTGLLYLTNNDGETVLYNEMYNLDRKINSAERYKQIMDNGGFTVADKVESKENRFMIFQGNRYHSSTCPTNIKERITVNYNFDLEV